MGTRNSTLVQIDGEYKVAQYCQWDGYPEGQGSGLINFLRIADLDKLKSNIRSLEEIDSKGVDDLLIECGHQEDSAWVSVGVSERFNEKYPHLNRDCGGYQLLEMLERGEVKSVKLDLNFPGHSLWCEWCYVIDFDLGKFEVYKGFNKYPLKDKERFFHLETDESSDYKQVKHLVSFDLYNLPTEEMFLSMINNLISNN